MQMRGLFQDKTTAGRWPQISHSQPVWPVPAGGYTRGYSSPSPLPNHAPGSDNFPETKQNEPNSFLRIALKPTEFCDLLN